MKKHISFVMLFLFAKLAFGEFKPGGFKQGVGTVPSIVDSLPDAHPASGGDIGVTVFNKMDSQTYRWNGLAWTGRSARDYGRYYPTYDTMFMMVYTKRQADSLFYLKTNPSGYITSFTELDPTFNTKFTAKSTTDLSEGLNKYYTDVRVGAYSDGRYPQLAGSYANPTWIASIAQGKITYTGTSAQYVRGDGVYTTFPTITQDAFTTKLWSKSVLVSNAGIIVADTFTISTATPTLTLPMPTGTTSARILAATGYRSGGNASNSPQIAISGMTTTSVSLIVTQQNTATVSILGINVLSGLPFILTPDPGNVKVIISYVCS